MRLGLSVSGSLKRELEQAGLSLQDAGNAAVVRQTDETKGAMRVQIASRLSTRAANALRSRRYVDPTATGHGEVAGYIYSGWWRKNRRGGDDIDMFKAFEDGAVIAPARGQALAIPLPAAYAVVGRGKKRPTPKAIEVALNVKLFPLKTRRGNTLLAITPQSGAVAISGRSSKIRPVRYVKNTRERSFPTTRRGAAVRVPIPMFLLLRNTRLPKRLDFAPIHEQGERGLAEKLLVELARREPT